ncbi:MAG TPA: hypothetical protein VGD63_01220 [Steroidobacteraceae bacterium]
MNHLARLKAEIYIQEAAKKLLREQSILGNARTADHLHHLLDVRGTLGNLVAVLKKDNAPGHWGVAGVIVKCIEALTAISSQSVRQEIIHDLTSAHKVLAVEHEREGLEIRVLPKIELPSSTLARASSQARKVVQSK